LENLRRRL